MMKKLMILSSLLLLFTAQAFAQHAPQVSTAYTPAQMNEMYRAHKASRLQDVYPSLELQKKLQTDFANARDAEWEKSDVWYEVEFKIGRFFATDYKAYYDMSNRLVMYKKEISTKDIPAIVKNAALANYPDFKIKEADKVVKGKEVFYQLELEKRDYDVKLTIDSAGVVVKEKID